MTANVPPILMNATHIFGRGMGESRIIAILEQYPTILTMELPTEKKENLVSGVANVGSKTAQLFVSNIPEFLRFIEQTGLQSKLEVSSTKVDTAHPLHGKKVYMTGFRNKDLKAHLLGLGAKVASGVSSKLLAVIIKDENSETEKATAAREKGIPVMTVAEFSKKYL